MQLAMYKGPPPDLLHRIGHWLVCIGTLSRYSHVELVIDGWCYSSSYQDGGVRRKRIDLTSGRWDVFEITGDQRAAYVWFMQRLGASYDWGGVVRFVLPFVRQRPGEYFCSEAVAAALGLPHAGRCTPRAVLAHFFPTP